MSSTSSVNSSSSLSVARWGMTEQFSGLSSTTRVSCCVIITTCGRTAFKCLLHPPQLRGERVSCSLLAQHNAEFTVTHTHLYSCRCEDQLWHDTVPHLRPEPLNNISSLHETDFRLSFSRMFWSGSERRNNYLFIHIIYLSLSIINVYTINLLQSGPLSVGASYLKLCLLKLTFINLVFCEVNVLNWFFIFLPFYSFYCSLFWVLDSDVIATPAQEPRVGGEADQDQDLHPSSLNIPGS